MLQFVNWFLAICVYVFKFFPSLRPHAHSFFNFSFQVFKKKEKNYYGAANYEENTGTVGTGSAHTRAQHCWAARNFFRHASAIKIKMKNIHFS